MEQFIAGAKVRLTPSGLNALNFWNIGAMKAVEVVGTVSDKDWSTVSASIYVDFSVPYLEGSQYRRGQILNADKNYLEYLGEEF